MLNSLEAIDRALFLFLNGALANPTFDAFFVVITNGRNWVVPLAVAVVFALVGLRRGERSPVVAYLRPNWRTTLTAVGLAIMAVAVTDPVCHRVLKPLFGRLRPCNLEALVEGGRFLLGHRSSLAMPSIHAANMFGAATVLTCFYRRHGVWLYAIAALVAFSRIYVGVHYPFDVLAGALFGTVVGLTVFAAFALLRARRVARRDAASTQV
jgi:undecaprenyl-diphosphatase